MTRDTEGFHQATTVCFKLFVTRSDMECYGKTLTFSSLGIQECSRGTVMEASCWIYSRQCGPKSFLNRKPHLPRGFPLVPAHGDRWPSCMSTSVQRGRWRLQVRAVIQSMMICNKGVINLPKGPGIESQCKMVQSTSINVRNSTICLWSGLTRQVNTMKRLLYQLERRYTLCDRVPNLCYEK